MLYNKTFDTIYLHKSTEINLSAKRKCLKKVCIQNEQEHEQVCPLKMHNKKEKPARTGSEFMKFFMLSSAETKIYPAHKC